MFFYPDFQTCLGASVWTYSEKILLAEEIISGTVLIFLYSSQASQNRMFSSLYSDLRNSRKAICPAEEGEGTRRSTVSGSSGISLTSKLASLTFTTEDFVHRLTPSLNIPQWIFGEATQSTLEKSIESYH